MKLFIATPCYGGMVTRNYMLSLLQLNNALRKERIPFVIATLGNDSLIPRARNQLAGEFLQEADATHLLFIDADISFAPEVVFRLLGHGGKVVAAACPKKKMGWDALYRSLPACKSSVDLQAAAVEYACNVADGGDRFEHEHFDGQIVGGFVRTVYAGTGFMLIQREALTALGQRYPELRYRPEKIAGAMAAPPDFHAFFDTLIHPKTRSYLGEDYSFCYRWRSCGGEIWLDVQSNLAHEGTHLFEGNPARLLEMLGSP